MLRTASSCLSSVLVAPLSSLAPPSVRCAARLSGLALVVLGSSVVLAGPAAAVDDPTRPDVRVTHGPSCRPGGVVVEVTAGTVAYAVRLLTSRSAEPEDAAELASGATAVLRTGEVAWGETIDSRLEFVAADGSESYVDELVEYSFTRPTAEDCAAIGIPPQKTLPAAPAETAPAPAPVTEPAAGTSAPATLPGGTSTGGASPAPVAVPAGDTTGSPQPAGSSPAAAPVPATGASEVGADGTVTVRGTGFAAGEQVTVQLHGTGTVLAVVTAGPDGTVLAELRMPDGMPDGPATVELVAASSTVTVGVEPRAAAVRIDDAGAPSPSSELVPLATAAAVLVATTAGLVSTAGPRLRSARRRLPAG